MAGKGKQEPKDIRSEELWAGPRAEFQDGQKSNLIRVVDWIINGKHYVKLEKRDFFMGDNGEWKLGKASGFSLKDLQFVQDSWDDIMKAFGANFAAPTGQAASQPAPEMATAPAAESDF